MRSEFTMAPSIDFHTDYGHEPVMLHEIVDVFASVPAGCVVDATLGGCGHAVGILRSHPHLSVLGIDQDANAIAHAESLREANPDLRDRLTVRRGRFDRLGETLEELGIEAISGALFDLGVSSPQFDRAERGFSYRNDGPLDMRMDASQSLSAFDVVNGYDLDRLTEVIRRYSDERFAHRIAKAIIAARTIETTSRLAEVVAEAIPAPARRTGGHPAKRTFQALRIEVNAELDVLPTALQAALDATTSGGRVAVLSYHSGEDRIVKHVFAEAQRNKGEVVASPFVHPESVQGSFRKVRAAQKPSREEMDRNPRASSARLRVIEKVGC